jgi:hypothetical protein
LPDMCLLSFDLPLPNIAARLVDDFVFLGSFSRGSVACLALAFSSFLESDLSDTELSVLL